MKLLSEAASKVMVRLDDLENEARQMASELDALDIRLHRAFTAVSIDGYVAYLNVERNRMLEREKQVKSIAGLTKLPALGIYGLVSLSMRRKPDWKGAVSSILREEPFGDIRVAISLNDAKLVNVCGIARQRGMTVDRVIAHLEGKGYRVLSWPEFEVEADNLRRAALKGEGAHLGIAEAGSDYIRALTTDPSLQALASLENHFWQG